MSEDELPAFRNPPVVETVLGVQFDRLSAFKNAHLGAFWSFLAPRHDQETGPLTGPWTELHDAPPIQMAFERFGDEIAWGRELTIQLTEEPSLRLQIRNHAGDAMIQVQNGRLHYNWIGRGGQAYRRYSHVRPGFDRLLAEFQEFLRGANLGELRPNQWEVTYVNHTPRGTVWDEPADWPGLFIGLPAVWGQPSFVRLDGLSGSWRFEIPPQRGRLHIDVKHTRVPSEPPQEVLRLTLTARGPVDLSETSASSFTAGLDLGRRAVVLTFRDITSGHAHVFWGLER